MVELTYATPPIEAMESYYQLASTLRGSGISQDDLGTMEKIWLRRSDIPSNIYHYVTAAFIAGFTGQPMPELLPAE